MTGPCIICRWRGESRGVDLCRNVGGSKLQPAGEMKIFNSAVTKQCLLQIFLLHNWGQNKCRQLLIALKPLFVLNVSHNSVNDIRLLSMSCWMQTQ